MFTLIPILILFLTPLVMVLIRLARPGFAYHWLVAALAALLAWSMALLSRLNLGWLAPLAAWQPAALFPTSPALLIDRVSWPFSLGLATLVLAVIFTDVARASESDWKAWAATLTLGGFGILAALSANLLTLLLAWAALDLVELLVLIVQVPGSADREKVVVAFSARVGGIFLLVWAQVLASLSVSPEAMASQAFMTLSPEANLFLLLAAGLRLGVLPMHLTFLKELPLRRGLGTVLRLAPASASLAVLVRVASVGIPESWVPLLLLLAGAAALFGAISWVMAGDELDGRPYWILGMAALTVASAVRRLPDASLAWGLATLFSGALLFLTSTRHPRLLPLVFFGLLGFSTLPLSPAWNGSGLLFFWPNPLPGLVFLASHALLLAGYARHSLRAGEVSSGLERWVWLIYPLGLALLPLTHFLFAAQLRLDLAAALSAPAGDLAGSRWWVGLLSLGLAASFWTWRRRRPASTHFIQSMWNYAFSLTWVYSAFWKLYRFIGKALSVLSAVLEGQGGLLWAMVLLAFLLAWLIQQGPGS